MRYFLFFLILILAATPADAQRRKKKRKTQSFRESTLILNRSENTVENGYCTYFYKGDTMAHGPLNYGLRSGQWQMKSGRLNWSGNYRADTMYGRWIYRDGDNITAVLNILPKNTYFADTTYFRPSTHISGIRENIGDSLKVLRLFHPNGQPERCDSNWTKKKHLVRMYWDEDGKLISHYELRNYIPWTIHVSSDDTSQTVRVSGDLKEGNGSCRVFEWDEIISKQSLIYFLNFLEGRFHGEFFSYTHEIEKKGLFNNGYLDQKWFIVYPSHFPDNDTLIQYDVSQKMEADTMVRVMKNFFHDPVWEIYNPKFMNTDDDLWRYLANELYYPQMARESGIMGKVYLSFDIDQAGMLNNVEILQSVHESLDNESLRVIRRMPPWQPGLQDGFPISIPFNMPINFVLQSN